MFAYFTFFLYGFWVCLFPTWHSFSVSSSFELKRIQTSAINNKSQVSPTAWSRRCSVSVMVWYSSCWSVSSMCRVSHDSCRAQISVCVGTKPDFDLMLPSLWISHPDVLCTGGNPGCLDGVGWSMCVNIKLSAWTIFPFNKGGFFLYCCG